MSTQRSTQIRAFRVTGNSEPGIYTKDAYDELRLQMSSGDFGAHRAEPVLIDAARDEHIDFIPVEFGDPFDCERDVRYKWMLFNEGGVPGEDKFL